MDGTMTRKTNEGDTVGVDRADAEAVLFRTAFAAFSYYPDRPIQEPGYTMQEDLDWCMEPLAALSGSDREAIRERIREMITDPSADRQSFILDIEALAD